ncbi:MAG TPA: hypothetical protein VK358_13565 [Longimicrobium sp.]|nr:hypothetical protein [Longimicrobium sp.]
MAGLERYPADIRAQLGRFVHTSKSRGKGLADAALWCGTSGVDGACCNYSVQNLRIYWLDGGAIKPDHSP